MPLALTFLDGVRWHGEPVVGDRPQALLAALALAGRVVRTESLVEQVWGDDAPASPAKALQVLVSRTRTACAAEAVLTDGEGYRLGLSAGEVDTWVLRDRTRAARDALAVDAESAGRLADDALALAAEPPETQAGGPLAELVRRAANDHAEATLIRARADARTGAHALAFPVLRAAWDQQPANEGLLVDLLRSEAAVYGPGSALERYEDYRADLADRLGADPGAEVQRAHADLLALDNPVREGVRYESTSLLGRDEDIRKLHGLLATSRVVSILGPGGLGKTRLAHLLGRESTVPTVHFIELVAVTVPDDLVGEVGSALGVRDSVSGRRALTPEQRADVRARIAQHLDASASLLILDNCEHIVEAVADLVAYLVATTRGVRVLTTTRAPLAIAAERVYALGELGLDDAVELFEQRAVAARPEVALARDEVVAVVERLDGLPLAIELAAAKVRVMAVADIARRLEDRFALLVGGDRSAPDRHRTLLAVIDWSWNLLDEPERQALRWLSVFHDGFTLAAAEAVLGPQALDVVQELADQSLVSVVDVPGGVRFRMLETVREFGRLRLAESGEEEAARAAHRGWALAYAESNTTALMGPGQFAAVDALRAEDGNLADVLRQALAGSDQEAVVRLLAALGSYWMILGDHARVWVLAESVAEALLDWTPPPALGDATRITLAMVVNNAMIGNPEYAEKLRATLREIGPGDGDPRIVAQVTIMQDFDPADAASFSRVLAGYAESEDRHLASHALQWSSYTLENSGDPVGALAAAERALTLVGPADGPWQRAILHTQIAQLTMQLGRSGDAVEHARAAMPVLDRLGANDDFLQLRALLVLAAVVEDDLDRAATELDRLGVEEGDSVFGSRMVIDLAGAELDLARGEVDAGLERYRRGVARVREMRVPGYATTTGTEPWLLFVESAALTAYGYHGAADDPYAADLFTRGLPRLSTVLAPDYPFLDYPVCGLSMFGFGAWGVLRGGLPIEQALHFLVLADRFAYNRTIPTMSWLRLVERLTPEQAAQLAEIDAGYGARRGPDLLEEARALVANVD